MKNEFREFYYKEEIDFDNLDDSVLIVFDTNVLLHIFRFSIESRNKLISSMNKVKSNIWIPYHVGLEYNLHKVHTVNGMREAENELKKYIDKEANKFKNLICVKLDKIGINSIDEKDIRRDIKKSFEENLYSMIEEWKSKELIKEFKLIGNVDDESEKLADVFDGKVGNQYSQVEIDKIEQEGANRYEVGFPPGYKDSKKDIRKKYGNITYSQQYSDLIIWKQILDKAKEEKIKKVVFVSDDEKEDWQYIYGSKKLNKGPRAELKKEMLDNSNADFYSLNTNSFLKQVIKEEFDIVDLSHTDNSVENYKDIDNNVIEDSNATADNFFFFNPFKENMANVKVKILMNKIDELKKNFLSLEYKMNVLFEKHSNLIVMDKNRKSEYFDIQQEIFIFENELNLHRDDLNDNIYEFSKSENYLYTSGLDNILNSYKELEKRYEYLLHELTFE